jgi:S-formylglutathione hydrolase FrmB
MPAVQLSFYTNMVCGGRYFDYVADELPKIMREFFHFSDRREDNFVAGLSMGGYGAFKLALSKPEQYCAAASLSGALDIVSLINRRMKAPDAVKNPERARMMDWVFGDTEKLKKSPHDLFTLLQQAKKKSVDLPKLFISCGTEDFLYQDNTKFQKYAQKLGVELTYHEEPGMHEWGYWDRNIQKVLAWLPI